MRILTQFLVLMIQLSLLWLVGLLFDVDVDINVDVKVAI